jgi:alpha,alpha-trehalase
VLSHRPQTRRQAVGLAGLFLFFLAACLVAQVAPRQKSESILDYINKTWAVLTRSNRDLAAAAPDPKFPSAHGPWPVYISRTENLQRVEKQLAQEMKPEDYRKIQIRVLPEDPTKLTEGDLLYLPRPYVVPGGRFNEMYGWDSYFIQVGLLRDNKLALAKDLADNFLYEIREYGKILNANRTYYLTRSQPPFLTQMLLAVYERTKDRTWLADSVPAIEKYYRFWMSEPHLTPETGLSRYWDLGDTPAPESVSAEHDAQGRTHYDLVKEYFRTHQIPDYDASEFYDAKTDRLTPLFYRADRSMRESGFDPSSRYGPFSADIIHYNPVCLNSLLYLMESQAAEIMHILGREEEVSTWRKRAHDRATTINRLMWDAKDGLYYDYNFVHGTVRRYPFLPTFYPLWAGIASKEQAAQVVRNLSKFERPGGLQTSMNQSGSQWDAPFGWAPLEMIAIPALRRYGYGEDADRTSVEFLSLVAQEFLKHGTIVEKYDVVRRSSNLSGEVQFGYSSNELGFGWTNAAFTTLYDALPPGEKQKVLGDSHP